MLKIKNKIYLIYFFTFIICLFFFLNLPFHNPDLIAKKVIYTTDAFRVNEVLKLSNEKVYDRDNLHPFFTLIAGTLSKSFSILKIDGIHFFFYRTFFGSLASLLFWRIIYKTTTLPLAFASLSLLFSTMTVKVWSTVPETFLFSFFILMIVLNLILEKKNLVLIVFFSIWGTVTNLMLGFFYIFIFHKINSIKKLMSSMKIIFSKILIVFFLIVILSIYQTQLYDSPYIFNIFGIFAETKHIYLHNNFIGAAFSFLYSGFLIPFKDISSVSSLSGITQWKEFFQSYETYNYKIFFLSIIFLILVTIIYILSIIQVLFKKNNSFNILLALFILFQFLMHLVWGGDPFLYSFNYLPIIIIFFALSLFQFHKSVVIYINNSFLKKNFNLLIPFIFIFMSFVILEGNINNKMWQLFISK
jgi:hypothetical protein